MRAYCILNDMHSKMAMILAVCLHQILATVSLSITLSGYKLQFSRRKKDWNNELSTHIFDEERIEPQFGYNYFICFKIARIKLCIMLFLL